MIPCLYAEAEMSFTTNGIGKLCDAISCSVTEKRNGSYELKMTYPSDGLHAETLSEGAVILAKPSERVSPQPFRIYKTTTPFKRDFGGGRTAYPVPGKLHHGQPVFRDREPGSDG